MAGQNGMGAQNTAMYSGMNGSIMPSAGHYSDMQTLMHNMDQLSGWLEQNRQDWAQVQEGLARVERLQGRMARDGQTPIADGETSVDESESSQLTYTQLQTALSNATQQIASLERMYQDQLVLQQMYEEAITETTDQVRRYCFDQQNYIIALHQHYTRLLSQSRSETIEAQRIHQDWQAAFQRLSEGVRKAYDARQAEGLPWKKRVAALKEENRILRQRAGLKPLKDSDDEDEEDSDLPDFTGLNGFGNAEVSRGRSGRTGQVTVTVQEAPGL